MESEDVIEAAGLVWHMSCGLSCQVCRTKYTSTWRKAKGYTKLCNRCGLRVQKATGDIRRRKAYKGTRR